MCDFFMEELKAVHQGLVLEKEQLDKLREYAELLQRMSYFVRREGLLALDALGEPKGWDAPTLVDWFDKYDVKALDVNSFEKYLIHLIKLVVDGTEPAIIKRIAGKLYVSSSFDTYEKLLYLIFVEGALSIQGGDNSFITGELLRAMLPACARAGYVIDELTI